MCSRMSIATDYVADNVQTASHAMGMGNGHTSEARTRTRRVKLHKTLFRSAGPKMSAAQGPHREDVEDPRLFRLVSLSRILRPSGAAMVWWMHAIETRPEGVCEAHIVRPSNVSRARLTSERSACVPGMAGCHVCTRTQRTGRIS